MTTTSTELRERYRELGTTPVPVEPYISPAYYELEKKYIFKRVWIHVGRVEEIVKPGDFFVRQLDACDASIIVVRNREGQIRAFHNVCSHRMNKIAYATCGSTRRFFCRFHGWAYDLNGQLVGVPDEKCFVDLNRAELGLTPVHVDVLAGIHLCQL